jgi:hypothetical protein
VDRSSHLRSGGNPQSHLRNSHAAGKSSLVGLPAAPPADHTCSRIVAAVSPCGGNRAPCFCLAFRIPTSPALPADATEGPPYGDGHLTADGRSDSHRARADGICHYPLANLFAHECSHSNPSDADRGPGVAARDCDTRAQHPDRAPQVFDPDRRIHTACARRDFRQSHQANVFRLHL